MNDMTLKELMNEWLNVFVKGTVSPHTYQSYFYTINALWRYLDPDIPVKDFNKREMQKALMAMAKDGLAKSTLTKAEQFVSRALEDELDIILGHCRIPRGANARKIDALSAEEQKVVEKACLTTPNGKIFLFLLDTGLRGKELCSLTWGDYDGVGIHVHDSKTEESDRYVPLTKRAKWILEMQPKGKRNDKLFRNEKTGYPFSDTSLKRTYMEIRKITGIETFSTRVCRHSFATRLFEAGANPKAVSTLMGHTSVAFTLQRYTTITREALFQGIALID